MKRINEQTVGYRTVGNNARRTLCAIGVCLWAVAGATATPTISHGPVETLCATDCRPVGGVGLAGDQLGFLIIESGTGSDVATFVIVDKATGDLISSTALGGSAGYVMTDIAADNAGGAWMVGTRPDNGLSIPGRWHSSDLATVDIPVSFDGNTDLSLQAVAADGTAFGVTNDDFATRVPLGSVGVQMGGDPGTRLPMAVFDVNGSGNAGAGNARSGGILTLAAWDGDALAFQDNVPGGNGVIGEREDSQTVLMGLRVPAGVPELGLFLDPFGAATFTSFGPVTAAELFGMDHYGFGFAFGSIGGQAAIFDTNTQAVVLLSDVGIGAFEALVAMDYLGGNEWLLVMENSVHYTLALINAPATDSDGDGVADDVDNCVNVVNPAQIDADGDLIGNQCDADYNNDCIVNPIDLGILRNAFFAADPVVDLNSDGIVNPVDLGIFRSLFFQPPGPGAPGNACE